MSYPIRASRPIWSLSFCKDHICGEICNSEYQLTNGLIRVTYTPNCIYPEKIEPMSVHVSEHTEQKIAYINEVLPDIPDVCTVVIDYPLRKKYTKEVQFNSKNIRMSDVLRVFDECYHEIYEQEEKTATTREWNIKKKCTSCSGDFYNSSNLNQYLKPFQPDAAVSSCVCNICFEETGEFYTLYCGHVFHLDCITKWYNTSKQDDFEIKMSNSCPNCRMPIIQCEACSGNTYLTEKFFGVVPKYSEEAPLTRWLTDGIWQIYGHHYEELHFKAIKYSKNANTLELVSQYKVDLVQTNVSNLIS